MKTTGIVVLIYGALVLVGGMIGYTATGSVASAVAGTVFGLGLLASAVAILKGKPTGLYAAIGLSGLLALFFGYRFAQRGVFMPGGMMALLSLAALIMLLLALRRRAT